MKLKKILSLVFITMLCGVFYGCATKGTTASATTANTPASTGVNSKVSNKISMAIGREVSEFTITNQQAVEAPAGYNGTHYTVNTNDGKTYKCEILEPSGFGEAMTWGMASGADAMCTDFTKGSADQGTTNKASCNALLHAAGKC